MTSDAEFQLDPQPINAGNPLRMDFSDANNIPSNILLALAPEEPVTQVYYPPPRANINQEGSPGGIFELRFARLNEHYPSFGIVGRALGPPAPQTNATPHFQQLASSHGYGVQAVAGQPRRRGCVYDEFDQSTEWQTGLHEGSKYTQPGSASHHEPRTSITSKEPQDQYTPAVVPIDPTDFDEAQQSVHAPGYCDEDTWYEEDEITLRAAGLGLDAPAGEDPVRDDDTEAGPSEVDFNAFVSQQIQEMRRRQGGSQKPSRDEQKKVPHKKSGHHRRKERR
ncbi:hypothetical protein QBC47DRAFT_391662 [Echria macrotheca]|uniref:Uncharacterized protein n=1 Tax=Echria macrotheca TaxID=438768 RepID=A0AAJ0B444_9PEZI|nr:hypothetical protein QBC47DRAFT_391662 [Echria macrotheca]